MEDVKLGTKSISFDEAIKLVEDCSPSQKTRSYVALVSSEYVSDTQISAVGEYVDDLFAEDLTITHENGEVEKVQPFQIENGDDTFEDERCDFDSPVYLGMYHYSESASEEQIKAIIAIQERIPLQYIILLPLDQTVSASEWHERALKL